MNAEAGAGVVEFGLLLAALALGVLGAAALAGGGVGRVLTSAIAAITG